MLSDILNIKKHDIIKGDGYLQNQSKVKILQVQKREKNTFCNRFGKSQTLLLFLIKKFNCTVSISSQNVELSAELKDIHHTCIAMIKYI